MDETAIIRRELEDSIATRSYYASKKVTVPCGGAGGAGAGALIGAAAGPVGALVGAVVGGVVGLIVGNAISDPLTEWLTCGKKFRLFCIHLNVDHQSNPTPAEVRRNYRYLMRIAHPDNNRDAPELVLINLRKQAQLN